MRLLSIYKTAERSVPPSQEEIAKQFLCEAGKGECKLRQPFEADQNTQAQKAPKS